MCIVLFLNIAHTFMLLHGNQQTGGAISHPPCMTVKMEATAIACYGGQKEM